MRELTEGRTIGRSQDRRIPLRAVAFPFRHDAFDRFFVHWCMVFGPPRCPDCGGHVGVGYFDYRMSELGPDCVRHAYCFDCGWALYESGRVEHPLLQGTP